MKRFISTLMCIVLLAAALPVSVLAAQTQEENGVYQPPSAQAASDDGASEECESIGIGGGGSTYPFVLNDDSFEANTGTSMYCWNMYLLNEGSFPDTLAFLKSLNTARVYQDIAPVYLTRQETADMAERLTENGIEVVALTGDRAWGKADADLTEIKSYIDDLAEYNSTIGRAAPITKLALDVETYTYSGWKNDPSTWFAAYITQMQEIYDYAKALGFSVVQVIPTHFDEIDEALFMNFIQTCADELSIMNYEKETQVTAIAGEVEICRSLDMPVETIFETMPNNDYYSVTEEKTYFYDGFDALCAKRDEILSTYRYENLSASYHHFPTMFHVVTGAYLAEIYAYTNSDDPTINDLGQTEALTSIILTGDDGSVITAGLYNPNRGAQYEETCYLAVGVREGVTYTVAAGSDNYEVIRPTKTFTMGEDDVVDYSSISIRALENTPETFTVTFLDYDGTVLKTQTVEKGNSAAAPSSPNREADEYGHYAFAGWDTPFDSVNSDLTVTAVYTLSEHSSERVGYREATCSEEGYTGDLVCSVCGELIEAGTAIPKAEHIGELVNEKAPTCSEEGYTGDLVCSVCGELIEAGTAIPKAEHIGELVNEKAPTCSEEGYTGDLVCSVCGEIIETGTAIPKAEHIGKLINEKAPTCSEEGYTGDLVCSVCGEIIETGTAIPKAEHHWVLIGNGSGTHSYHCTVCGTAGETFSCADSNNDGLCDSCASAMPPSGLPDNYTKVNQMSDGNAYIIFSGKYAIGKSLRGTKLTMSSANGKYVPDEQLSEELLWYYEDGRIFCTADGVNYYLGCSLGMLTITDDVSEAAVWTCSDGRIYTQVRITSWWTYNVYLGTLGSRFTLSSIKKSVTVYEAC